MAGGYYSFFTPHHDWILRIDGDRAVQLGGYGNYLPVKPGQSLEQSMLDTLQSHEQSTLEFAAMARGSGEFHPRVWRPFSPLAIDMESNFIKFYRREFAVARAQMESLCGHLRAICRVVHPEGPNLDSSGLDIRSLLLLACTEVEASWRSIMVANGFASASGRFSTNDYVKLLRPLRLDDYSAQPTEFPWLGKLRPFQAWNSASPTQSLPWYDAYNATKHDREGQLVRATLNHALEAVAAASII